MNGIRHLLTFLCAGSRRGIGRSGPYGLRLLIFPQPLGRALKNQNAAPTTPPCFGRRPRSSSLLFKSWRPSERHPTLFDIPMRWNPQRELMVRALRVAFADFSTAPWQGLEKSERCPNNSSLFRPQAAVVVVAVQVLTGNKIEHPDGCSFLLWASQDLNPGPSGYENVANFEIPFFLWNLVTI